MKCSYAAVFLLAAPLAAAFQAVFPSRGRTTALLGSRQSYQHYLEELSRKGKFEANSTAALVNGAEAPGAEAPKEMGNELTAAQQQERVEVRKRVDAIQENIDANWKDQEATVHALRVEIIKQETDVIIADTSRKGEPPEVKIKAQKEAIAIVEQYKAREEELRQEMKELQTQIEEELQPVLGNQKVTDSIITPILAIDEGLDALLEQYDEESKAWLRKLEAEQAEWDLAAKMALIAEAEAEVARLSQQVQAIEKEKLSQTSLFKRTLKAMLAKTKRE